MQNISSWDIAIWYLLSQVIDWIVGWITGSFLQDRWYVRTKYILALFS